MVIIFNMRRLNNGGKKNQAKNKAIEADKGAQSKSMADIIEAINQSLADFKQGLYFILLSNIAIIGFFGMASVDPLWLKQTTLTIYAISAAAVIVTIFALIGDRIALETRNLKTIRHSNKISQYANLIAWFGFLIGTGFLIASIWYLTA